MKEEFILLLKGRGMVLLAVNILMERNNGDSIDYYECTNYAFQLFLLPCACRTNLKHYIFLFFLQMD